MAEINLLKKESQDTGRLHFRAPTRFSLYFLLGLLLFEFLVYGFLYLGQKRTTKETLATQQRNADIDLEVSKIDPDRKEAISAQSRLKNLEVLLNSHLFWSQVFSELENKSFKPIQLNSLQVDNAQYRFILSGNAASQTDLAKFMLGLKTSPYISNVTLRSTTAQQTEISGYLFNLELTFDPKLLRK